MANQSKSQASTLNQNAKIHIAAVVFLVAVVCVSAALALAFAGAGLTPMQRWLLTVFLILFPIAGLGSSVWLILRHYQKLALVASEEDFSWTTMTPEQQRRKLNLEVARIKQETSEGENIHQLYVSFEDLALRQVEAENQMPLFRHIVLEGVPFDGVTIKDGRVFCVEVAFLVVPDLPQEKVDALLDKVEYAARRVRQKVPAMRVRLLLALVTKLNQQAENRLRTSLAEKFALTPVDVDVRFLRHDFLQKTFIAE
ncbi:MAG: hypothetical protein M3209_04040 [Acidobacteriota bacterium]|nr:hypothetical protein [Acidobacteriota bacterium]